MVIRQWTSYNTKYINIVVPKLISLYQTVSTEATLLLRNSAEIDGKGHINIENMRQSGNKI